MRISKFFLFFVPGDEYDEIKISWSDLQNLTQLSEAGLQITRSDYYAYLKCYCLAIREGSDWNEVSRIHVLKFP